MVALLVTGVGSAAGVQARISWHPRRSAIGRKQTFKSDKILSTLFTLPLIVKAVQQLVRFYLHPDTLFINRPSHPQADGKAPLFYMSFRLASSTKPIFTTHAKPCGFPHIAKQVNPVRWQPAHATSSRVTQTALDQLASRQLPPAR